MESCSGEEVESVKQIETMLHSMYSRITEAGNIAASSVRRRFLIPQTDLERLADALWNK